MQSEISATIVIESGERRGQGGTLADVRFFFAGALKIKGVYSGTLEVVQRTNGTFGEAGY